MQPLRTVRLALCGGALALVLSPGLARAQDGQPPSGRPVTDSKTNKQNPRPDTSTPPARTSDQVLPGVPATRRDPAPVGTRAVPATSPAAPTGLPPAATPGAARVPGAPRPLPPGVFAVEGVVTKITKPDKSIPGALIQITVDPTQDWSAYANGQARTAPKSNGTQDQPAARPAAKQADADAAKAKVAERRAEVAAAKAQVAESKAKDKDDATVSGYQSKLGLAKERLARAEDKADAKAQAADAAKADAAQADAEPADVAAGSKPLDLVFTSKTRMVTFARLPDGTDLPYAATEASPDVTSSRTGLTRRPPVAPTPGPKETNFTNIKEGSFVAAQYRKVGDRNELTSLSLIEPPLIDPTAPGAATAPGAPRAKGAIPARVPTVPTQPVGAGAGLPR